MVLKMIFKNLQSCCVVSIKPNSTVVGLLRLLFSSLPFYVFLSGWFLQLKR